MTRDLRFNVQQIPKLKEVLECFRPAPGCVLVDSDVASLEPKVMAHFSQDPKLLELYASGRPHDVYLYVGIQVDADTGPAIADIYRPDSPTKESVAAAKAAFKAKRQIYKVLHLSASYGASARKLHQTLNLSGVPISMKEVEAMHWRYWNELFRGLKDWGWALRAEREDRGGWILNGRGRPLCIPDHRVKDITNAFTQSTGHDCLLTLVYYIDRLRRERSVPMRPWIPDLHDQTIWEVPAERAEDAVAVFRDAYEALNRELSADIKIVGDISVGRSLYDLKGE